MDAENVGKAIAYLRKRAGYTQKDLADRIGISDKAVSKWERGQGLPEIGYLRELSIILDTDTDSLLSGDVVHHDGSWYGVIVMDNNAPGIGAGTMIYDKPLINYLLCYFLLVGIKNIIITCTESDKKFIVSELGNGEEYGIRISVVTNGMRGVALELNEWLSRSNSSAGDSPCVDDKNIMMVYGRCFLYGVDQTRFFQRAMINRNHFTMLVLPKKMSQCNNHILIDEQKRVINSNSDEPLRTQYDFTNIPIVFFPGEKLTEMTDLQNPSLINDYISGQRELYVQVLDRGFVEIELDNWNDVQEASSFMRIVQNKCGMNVYCLEEVAWRRGMISMNRLKDFGNKFKGTEYGDYIISIYERFNEMRNQQ